jgi:uncharacterized coiled-coil DUF342 family protein
MTSFQQKLLVVLALALCGLCAYPWYVQTLERDQIQRLNQLIYEKSVMIRDCTNSIASLNHQLTEMDARLTDLRATMKTNETLVISQKHEINRLEATSQSLTNELAEYKKAVGTLEDKLKEAYAGITKQNQALKDVVAQRDEFVQKYNDSVRDRNEVVAKYNALVDQVNKIQAASKK